MTLVSRRDNAKVSKKDDLRTRSVDTEVFHKVVQEESKGFAAAKMWAAVADEVQHFDLVPLISSFSFDGAQDLRQEETGHLGIVVEHIGEEKKVHVLPSRRANIAPEDRQAQPATQAFGRPGRKDKGHVLPRRLF